MIDAKCPVRLNQLLAKVWDLHRKRELAHHNEVAKRAAQKAVEEPGEFSVAVPDFGYRISFDENGEIVEDPLADPEIFPESIPSPEIKQQALDIRKKMLTETKEIAEGRTPEQIYWDGEQVVSESFLAQYPPIAGKWDESFEFGNHWAEQGGFSEKIWEFVAKEIAQATDPQKELNPVALFRYAEQIEDGDMTYSSNASYEINRLDSSGFADWLYGELMERYPEELREIGIIVEADPDVGSEKTTLQQDEHIPERGESVVGNRWERLSDGDFVVEYSGKKGAVKGIGATRLETLLSRGEASVGELSGDDAGLSTAESIKKSDSVETHDGVGGLDGKDKTGETEIMESAGKVKDKLSQIEADLSELPPDSIVERSELEAEKQELLKWFKRYFDINGKPRTSLSDPQKRKKTIERSFSRIYKDIEEWSPELSQHLENSISYDENTRKFRYSPKENPGWNFGKL